MNKFFAYDDGVVNYRGADFFPLSDDFNVLPSGDFSQEYTSSDGRSIEISWSPSSDYALISSRLSEIDNALLFRAYSCSPSYDFEYLEHEASRLRDAASYLLCNGLAFDFDNPVLIKEFF